MVEDKFRSRRGELVLFGQSAEGQEPFPLPRCEPKTKVVAKIAETLLFRETEARGLVPGNLRQPADPS